MDVPVLLESLSPVQLRELVMNKLKTPMVFKNKIDGWSFPLSWSHTEICQLLAEVKTTFKICPKRDTSHYNKLFKTKEVVFETQCTHIEATYSDMHDWFNNDIHRKDPEPKKLEPTGRGPEPKRPRIESTDSPLSLYPRDEYWIYADYKYMSHICIDHPKLINDIDWSVFGFEGRNGNQSTLWIGSEESCTPCHYDTYGCNLVAQLSGRKKWVLFAPSDTKRMYPTRVPYEESSVFSQVNIINPDLEEYPQFKDAIPYQVVLSPGDVLFVPHHWWHYVECIDSAISVNTWIDLPQDDIERTKEALIRVLVSSLSEENDTFVNPNEVIFSHEENMRLLNKTVQSNEEVNTKEIINIITSDDIIEMMRKKLTEY